MSTSAAVAFATMPPPKEKQLVVRVDDDLYQRVQAYVTRVRRETGFPVSQSDAVRRLLAEALDRAESARKR